MVHDYSGREYQRQPVRGPANEPGESPGATLGLGYALTFDDGHSLSFSVSKGLTAASSDYGVGGAVRFAF